MSNILLIDDDLNLLRGVQRALRKEYPIDIANSWQEGIDQVKKRTYEVVISDMNMPGKNGVEVLQKVQTISPDSTRIMLTGNATQKTAADAINRGAIFRFLTKPCPPETLAAAIKDGIRQYRLVTAEKELLQKTLVGSVKVLTDLLSLVDPIAFGRGMKAREYVQNMLKHLSMAKPWEIELAAMLVDLGALTLPTDVRSAYISPEKRPFLDEQAIELINNVPQSSAQLLQHIPRLSGSADLIISIGDTGEDRKLSRSEQIMHIAVTASRIPYDSFTAYLSSRSFDNDVLRAAQIAITKPQGESAQFATQQILELKVGDILAQDVRQDDGTLLARSGHAINQSIRAALQNAALLKKVPLEVKVMQKASHQPAA